MTKTLKIISATFVLGVSFFAFSHEAEAARFILSPSEGAFTSGNKFNVTLYIDTEGAPINAAEGSFTFPTRFLQVDAISTQGSVFKFWSQDPTFSNAGGSLSFGGGLPSPGVSGSNVKVLTITFRSVSEGAGFLKLQNGAILANDGIGTNVLTSSQEGNYRINTSNIPPPDEGDVTPPPPPPSRPGALLEPKITSQTHPDENSWYNKNTFEASWSIPAGATGVSYVLVQSSNYSASPQNKGLISSASYDLSNLDDGNWYFYLQFRNENGWGERVKRRVRIDRGLPSSFLITRRDLSDPTNPQPAFMWQAEDSVSGIARYEVKISDGDWFNASTLTFLGGAYIMPLQSPGTRNLIVRAFDGAGNMSEAGSSFTVEPLAMPRITDYSKDVKAGEAFVVRGTAPARNSVVLRLQKGDDILEFVAKADERGDWRAEYLNDIPSGKWRLTALTKDERGALSYPTDAVEIRVSSIFGKLSPILFGWGGSILLGILILSLIIGAIYFMIHHLFMWRILMKKDLRRLKMEIQKDLKLLDKEIEPLVEKTGSKKTRQRIEKLEEELEENIGRLN